MSGLELADGSVLTVVDPDPAPVVVFAEPDPGAFTVVPDFGLKGDPGDPADAPVQSVNDRRGDVDGLAENADLLALAGLIPGINEAISARATIDQVDAVAELLPPLTDGLAGVQTALPNLATKAEVAGVQASVPDVSGLATQAALAAVAATVPASGGYATPAQLSAASTADRNRANHTGQQGTDTIAGLVELIAAQVAARLGIPLGLAPLDANGLLPTSVLPPLAIGRTVTVANAAARLALTDADVQQGDGAVEADSRRSYRLNAGPVSDPASWVEITSPLSGVLSVNGDEGHVTGLATQSALAAHVGDANNPHSVTKGQVGLGNVANLAPAELPVSAAAAAALAAKADAALLGAYLTEVDAAEVYVSYSGFADQFNYQLGSLRNNPYGVAGLDSAGQVDPSQIPADLPSTQVGYSSYAGSASSAGYATSAGSAGSATYATSAGSANTATTAGALSGVSATAAELNKLAGATASTAELNRVTGVSGNIQTQINAVVSALESAPMDFPFTSPTTPRPATNRPVYWRGPVAPSFIDLTKRDMWIAGSA